MEPLLCKETCPTSICRCQDSPINPELEKRTPAGHIGVAWEIYGNLTFARLFIRMNFCPAGLAWIFAFI